VKAISYILQCGLIKQERFLLYLRMDLMMDGYGFVYRLINKIKRDGYERANVKVDLFSSRQVS